MASTNEETLRAAFAAWNRGDLETAMEAVAEDVRWETGGVFPGFDPVYEGWEGVRRFWSEWMAPWETIGIDPLEVYEPRPNRLVLDVRFRASGRQGIEVDAEIWQLYVMRDGKLVEFRAFAKRDEAFAAAVDA